MCKTFYILGDLLRPTKEYERLIKRVKLPRIGELKPMICKGWWEEQCLILHGLGPTGDTPELIAQYGGDTVKRLWDSISPATVQCLRSLDFGFFKLDCLLIHASKVGVSEGLTPETPLIQMLDRLSLMSANNIFCERSGLTFQYQLHSGSFFKKITTLDQQIYPQTVTIIPHQVIGVGSV